MIKLIYKTIWNEKKSNLWILIELILIFVILFFCADFAYKRLKQYVEPLGFDIANTYNISLGQIENDNEKIEKSQSFEIFQRMIEKIKKHPYIDNVCISTGAIPYDDSYRNIPIKIDSTNFYSQLKFISPSFFDVFGIKLIGGRNFSTNDIITNSSVILSGTSNTSFLNNIALNQIDSIELMDKTKRKVVGFTSHIKRSEYEDTKTIAHFPFTQNSVNKWNTTISFKMKEEADKTENIEQLKKDFSAQLNISPYFFVDIISSSKNREQYMHWTGNSNEIKSIGSVSVFLLVNIFLGVIGTFWLRIQSRRSEIGLQMAMGASRKKIKLFYSLESLSLLFIASIIGFVVAVNILATGIIDSIGISGISSDMIEKLDYLQMLIDYLITFGVLAIITLIAVWIPSSVASKISPALVLRSE